LEEIRQRWFYAVREHAPLYKEEDFHVLADDRVKQSKEGRRMPGVKKLFKESENHAKPKYIKFEKRTMRDGYAKKRSIKDRNLKLPDIISDNERYKEK